MTYPRFIQCQFDSENDVIGYCLDLHDADGVPWGAHMYADDADDAPVAWIVDGIPEEDAEALVNALNATLDALPATLACEMEEAIERAQDLLNSAIAHHLAR